MLGFAAVRTIGRQDPSSVSGCDPDADLAQRAARAGLTIMHVKRTVNVHAQRKVAEVERTIGLDKARGKLGQLAEEVRAENAPVVLMRRGEPLAVLVSPAEYERLTAADRRAAAEQLQARLIEVRKTVRKAGLDVAVVDKAIAAARAAG